MARKPAKRTKTESNSKNRGGGNAAKQSPSRKKTPKASADKRLNAAFGRIAEED